MPEERKTIREAVAEQLGNLSQRTREAVIEHFAAEQAQKQAAAIISGLSKLADLENQRRRIKPVPAGFNAAGDAVGEPMFTKEQITDMKKLDEQIEKLSKAITKADEQADFGDLYNATKGGGGGEKKAD